MYLLFAFGLPHGPEWIIIFLVIILLFGASRLPGLARSIGKSLGEFRKAREELDREIRQAAEVEETKRSPLPETRSRMETDPTDLSENQKKDRSAS
ncbi:MAG: twin-arginine translocase TatA/TatE family subunit [Candidatus Methylacidiphilales bacterium]